MEKLLWSKDIENQWRNISQRSLIFRKQFFSHVWISSNISHTTEDHVWRDSSIKFLLILLNQRRQCSVISASVHPGLQLQTKSRFTYWELCSSSTSLHYHKKILAVPNSWCNLKAEWSFYIAGTFFSSEWTHLEKKTHDNQKIFLY